MRLIDADAVPKEFWDYEFDGKWSGCTIKDLLDSQPTVHPEPHWIPCSERLPEKHQMVLTIIKGVDLFRECMDKNFFEALETAKKRTLVSVGYLGDDGWYGVDGFPQIIPTVAWMPMPEPYREAIDD